MTIFDKYSINNEFTNYSLESFLKDLGISETLRNQILVRISVSSLTKELIEKLKKIDEKQNIYNVVFEYFLVADTTKPITCNKIRLSELTGLSERSIDERRRARKIPFIQISGGSGVGKKTIVYDPIEVMNHLKECKVAAIS